MKTSILVDLERCVGCWSCSMACKIGNGLADDEYRLTVRTLGSGTGIDRPAGVYPKLTMGWQPVYNKSCVFCAPRVAEGNKPYCIDACPTNAIAFGDAESATSDYSVAAKRVRDAGYRVVGIGAWENTKPGISYASRK